MDDQRDLLDGGASLRGNAKATLVQRMFNQIVPRYDLMNRLMTGGQDQRWRRLAAVMSRAQGTRALDLATGTGDLALELARIGARQVVGADFASRMLQGARPKVGADIPLVLGDAQHLPFQAATFDRVTNAFLLRNLSDLDLGLREMRRVLAPGGLLVSLEITRPSNRLFARAFGLYFYHLVPVLGGIITSQRAAYRYLPNSLTTFPRAAELSDRMCSAGFATVSYQFVGFGTVAIHVARVPV